MITQFEIVGQWPGCWNIDKPGRSLYDLKDSWKNPIHLKWADSMEEVREIFNDQKFLEYCRENLACYLYLVVEHRWLPTLPDRKWGTWKILRKANFNSGSNKWCYYAEEFLFTGVDLGIRQWDIDNKQTYLSDW